MPSNQFASCGFADNLSGVRRRGALLLIWFLPVALVLVTAGCSILSGFDDVALNVSADAGDLDARVPNNSSDGPVPVLGDDAAVGLDAEPVDSGVDAAPTVVDSGALRFCLRGTHAFCSDFEEQTDVLYGWSDKYLTSGGLDSIALDGAHAKEGQGAALMTLVAHAAASANSSAALLYNFDGTAKPTTIEFDLFVEPPAWGALTGKPAIAGIAFYSPDYSQQVNLSLAFGAASLFASIYVFNGTDHYTTATATGPLPTGQMVHVKVAANVAKSGSQIQATLTPTTGSVVTVTHTGIGLASVTNLHNRAIFGFNRTDGNGIPQIRAWIDNATVDVQ